MPIQFPDFPRISFQEANPGLMGAQTGMQLVGQGQDLYSKLLANKIAQVQAQYANPMAQQALQKAVLENKWYAPNIQSEIDSRRAQAGLAGQESDKIRYMLQHPGFLGDDTTKSLEALRQMGLIGQDYQPSSQGQNISKSDMGISSANYTPGSYIPMQNEDVTDAISNAVVRQQQNMNIPQNQVSQPIGQPSPTGFNVNGLVQALIQKPMTDLQYKRTLTQVMQQNLAGKPYTSMPAVEKEYSIAQARAFGYTGEQASKLFNQGYDLASMAQEKGYNGSDPSSWPAARGAPTTAIQTRIQRANSTLAALDAVAPEITQSYAKYAPRFRNVSPGLIMNMLSGQNPDDQADALAAYALYPEIAALRINAMGGNVGEGAIQHIADASFSRLNTLGISPNSLVYQKVQDRLGKLIGKMNKAENSAIYGQRNRSFEEDDKSNALLSQRDLNNMSVDQLQQIAAGG